MHGQTIDNSNEGGDFQSADAPSQSLVRKCGRHNPNGISMQFLSDEVTSTQFGEWPHMCVIYKTPDLFKSTHSTPDNIASENTFVCGATLITPGNLLTAAHCIK